jgi:hypothetical protein
MNGEDGDASIGVGRPIPGPGLVARAVPVERSNTRLTLPGDDGRVAAREPRPRSRT